MNLDPVKARLKEQGLKRVDGAASLALIGERPTAALPAVYVVPDSESFAPPRAITGIHDQKASCDFLVVIRVGAHMNPDAADAELEQLKDDVEAALVGWVHPDAEGEATAATRSRLLSVSAGTIDWAAGFRTYRRIRKAAS